MSTEQTIEYARASLTPVKDIEAAPWNVNVMPPDKFAVLKADMKEKGPKGVDPIHYCKLGDHQYTIDGAQRLTAAKELGWLVAYTYFHPEVVTEEQARLFNYKRDAERGDIDPFRLAASFKWFQDNGMKQEDIASKFGIDVSTVSKRLSLLKIPEEVKVVFYKQPSISVSHIEPLAALPEGEQKKLAKEVLSRDFTVREVEDEVRRAKQEIAEREKLTKAVGAAKFPKCPTCGKPPVRIQWGGLPRVVCTSYHDWSLEKGLAKSPRAAAATTKSWPQHVKSQRTTSDFIAAAQGYFQEGWPKFTEVNSIDIEGTLRVDKGRLDLSDPTKIGWVTVNGKVGKAETRLSISTSRSEWGDSMSIEVTKGDETYFSLNAKENKTENKTFKTYVTNERGEIRSEKDLSELEAKAEKFLADYLPRGKKVK